MHWEGDVGKRSQQYEQFHTVVPRFTQLYFSSDIIYSFPLLVDEIKDITPLPNRFLSLRAPYKWFILEAVSKNQVQSKLCGNSEGDDKEHEMDHVGLLRTLNQ